MAREAGPRFGPRNVLRWVIVLALGAMALGSGVVAVVVGAGKFGLRLIPTLAMDVLIATIAWSSIALSAVIAGGFAAAAVLLARQRRAAMWAWMAGFVAAFAQQALESTQAANAGAEVDTSGYGVLAMLAVLGWGVYTIDFRRPPALPPRYRKP